MKTEDIMDVVKDEYIIEAENYSFKKTDNVKSSLLKWSLAAAAVVMLCTALVILLSVPAKDTAVTDDAASGDASVETSRPASGDSSGSQSEDEPISSDVTPETFNYIEGTVYLAGPEQPIPLAVNKAVTIRNVYTPEKEGYNGGIHFQVSLEGYRIDAMTDHGSLTADNGVDNANYYSGNQDTAMYFFGRDQLKGVWHPTMQEDYWDQEAVIRLYAVKDNAIYMYAVINIKPENNTDFVAELSENESYVDIGGVVITDENRDKFYPEGKTEYKTCDINDVLAGKKPTYISLNAQQPITMKINPLNTGDEYVHKYVRDTLPFSVPLLADKPEGKYKYVGGGNGLNYDPELCLVGPEIYYYLAENNAVMSKNLQKVYKKGIDSKDELKFLVMPDGFEYKIENPSQIAEKELSFTVKVTTGLFVKSLATFGVYTYPIDDHHSETIFIIEKYEEYEHDDHKLHGKPDDNDTLTDFNKGSAEKRAEEIWSSLPELTDELIEYVTKMCEAAGYSDNSLEWITNWASELKKPYPASLVKYYIIDQMKSVITENPQLDNESIAEYGMLRSFSFYGRNGGGEQAKLDLRLAQALGKISRTQPPITLLEAEECIEEFKKIYAVDDSDDTEWFFSRKDADRLVEMFNEYAGAPDMTVRWEASGTYSQSLQSVYQLADGSHMVVNYRNFETVGSSNVTVEHIANDNSRKWLFNTENQ